MRNLPYADLLSEEDKIKLNIAVNDHQTDDEVWDFFARSAIGPGAIGKQNREKVIKVLHRVRQKIGGCLCEDEKIKWFLETNEASDTLSLAMVISGRLSNMLPAGMDVVALSLLITRIGLRQFCSSKFN